MINVNQITSQLARMPDQALQQYAMMHKNDPYTVSLALSESNRRKQMREGAQGAQGKQPKVVDQDIAAMAAPAPQPQQPPMPQGQAQPMPEDVGIGALPAQNMQGMAGGGIVAFGSGGDVPRVGSHNLAAIIPDKTGYEGMGIMEFLQAFGSDMLAKLPTEEKERLKQTQAKKEAIAAPTMQAYGNRPTMEAGQEEALYEKVGLMPRAPVADVPVAGPVATPPAGTPPGAGAGAGTGVASLAAAPRAPAVPEKSFADRLKAGMGENPEEDRFATRRAGITATAKKGAEEGLAKLKADQEAEMASMFKGKEERIGKRESELEKSKDTNTGMAFLEAGLAMIQARGPGLAGIAQGAGVGLKQYQSGIKDIKAAQEKLDEARDRMEELRQNQSSMNKREVRAEEKGIRDIVTQGERDYLAGAEKAYNVKREDVRAAVTSDITRAEGALDRASREAIAKMPSAQIQMINKLGGGDFAKGYEIYKQEAAVPRLYESYTKMASDPFKGAEFQAKYPTFDTYMAGSGMLGGGGGKILDLPNAAAGAVRPR